MTNTSFLRPWSGSSSFTSVTAGSLARSCSKRISGSADNVRGPCAWIIVAEIWPLSARPYGVALGASSNWMNNFIVSDETKTLETLLGLKLTLSQVGQVTPDMLQKITYGTYIIFGLLTYLGAAFVWFLVPETKRLTLEEMVSCATSSCPRAGPWLEGR